MFCNSREVSMRSLNFVVTVSALFAFSNGCSSSSSNNPDGGGVTDAPPTVDLAVGTDSQADTASTPDMAASDAAAASDASASDAAPLSAEATRGKYLVGVLGC